MMDDDILIIESNKGGINLACNGYLYNKVKSTDYLIYWKCNKRKHCKGSAHTNLLYGDFAMVTRHAVDCIGDPFKIQAIFERSRAKKLAKDTREKPARLFARSISRLSDEARLSFSNENAFRRTIQRVRSNDYPPIPVTMEELVIEGSWAMTFGEHPSQFLRYDNRGSEGQAGRMIIFFSDAGINLLSSASVWYMDGNFKMSPQGFLQLYVIRVPLGTTAVTVAFCVLERKSKATYTTLFEALMRAFEELGLEVNVRKILCDFEMAVIKSIQTTVGTLRQIDITGCFYHLSSNVLDRVQNFGLVVLYRQDPDLRLFVGMMLGLAFLPIEEVVHGMRHLESVCPVEMEELLTYFDSTYVRGPLVPAPPGADPEEEQRRRPPLFPPHVWNVHLNTLNNEPRTNNQCEGWNNRFYHLVGYHHPSIWALTEALKLEEAKVATLILADVRGDSPTSRKRKDYIIVNKRLKTCCEARRDRTKSIPQFLKSVGYSIGWFNRSQDYGQTIYDDQDGVAIVADPALHGGDDGLEEADGNPENEPVFEVPEAFIICDVCLGERNEPHVFIPCGHIFCSNCKDVLMAQENSRCPTCRGNIVDAVRVFV